MSFSRIVTYFSVTNNVFFWAAMSWRGYAPRRCMQNNPSYRFELRNTSKLFIFCQNMQIHLPRHNMPLSALPGTGLETWRFENQITFIYRAPIQRLPCLLADQVTHFGTPSGGLLRIPIMFESKFFVASEITLIGIRGLIVLVCFARTHTRIHYVIRNMFLPLHKNSLSGWKRK